MGNIKKRLACVTLDDRLWEDGLSLELCENVHFHYRDIRLEFSCHLFEKITDVFTKASISFKKYLGQNDFPEDLESWYYRKNFNRGRPVAKEYIKIEKEDYGQGRFIIELQDDKDTSPVKEETIHIHIHNLRLHVTKNDFMKIAEAFAEALRTLEEEII